MKKFYILSVALLAFAACSNEDGNDDNSGKEPAQPTYETITFEACEIPESGKSNIPANGAENTYEECGASFTCVNELFLLSGIWVANAYEEPNLDSEYSSVLSDRYVICGTGAEVAGADDTANYSVWNFNSSNKSLLPQMTFGEGVAKKIVSAKVNNVAKYWYVIKAGYYSQPAFSEGDYYEVIFTGYDAAGEVTGTVPVIMADYRDGKTFVMEEWTEVDLSALGEVNKVVLTATPSETLANALYGDHYAVCVDEIKFEVPAEE